jgi:hypothetical protein
MSATVNVTTPCTMLDRAKRAVLRVGGGRGFVVERRRHLGLERVVITATHCLPQLPPAHPMAVEEQIYPLLLRRLTGKRTAWAQCLFVDPVVDIAVLGQPDNQALCDEADAYDRLLDRMEPLRIANAPAPSEEVCVFGELRFRRPTPGKGPGYVLSLEGRWLRGDVTYITRWVGFTPMSLIAPGMSGSPILSAAGEAIGLISTGRRPGADGLPSGASRARHRRCE